MANIILAIGVVAIYAFVVVLMLSGGLVPKTPLGWVSLFAIGIPFWIALELVGHVMHKSQRLNRLSSPLRVLILLACVLAVVAAAFVFRSAINFASDH